MIQQQTSLKVIDNSGAKIVKCIKVLGGFKKKKSFSWRYHCCNCKKIRNRFKITSKVCKGELYKAIVLRTKIKRKKKDGSFFCFFENSVCLLNSQEKPIATRILGPISKEFRKKKQMKLVNIASGFF